MARPSDVEGGRDDWNTSGDWIFGNYQPARPVRMAPGASGQGGGGGLAAMLAPQGTRTSSSVVSHPFTGLQALLESSILGRLMKDQPSVGLKGGGIAYGHLEDPYGRLTTTTNTYRPAAVAPPRNRGLGQQLQNPFNMTKVLDENGWPVEAFPGPWTKTGRRSDGSEMQYTNGGGENIANPYL